ncbi:protein of unknown function [Legionella longbeachae NSW150]|uniref:Uncharacterized protein n=1 Tax=Legionella longbeachae serogroup 1 (strain NSW150) TaxID=661367 RepID=D3HJ17_LEGLN|nr:protein of unknown function [Legionella longbeachae NSW150]
MQGNAWLSLDLFVYPGYTNITQTTNTLLFYHLINDYELKQCCQTYEYSIDIIFV